MRDSIQYPAIRIVYGGVCLLAVAASLRFRAVPSPPLASPNCILFIIMHPLSRSVLSSPRRPLPSHTYRHRPPNSPRDGATGDGKKAHLSIAMSHLDPRIRHARAALLRSPIKGYYDGAIGSPRCSIMMTMGSSWLVGGDPGYSEYGGCKGQIRWHTEI